MDWIERACRALDAAEQEGGWGYQPGAPPAAEPTALVTLAQRAYGRPCAAGAGWLASLQLEDGSVPIGPGRAAPSWPTPLALLAWLAAGAHADAVARACELMFARRGEHWPPAANRNEGLGHDTSLVGWPWVAGTHSWVEPTAFAVCALGRAGHASHSRVRAGRAMLLDRVVPGGGWNFGNTQVLGNDLRPFPAPTGIALLATLPEARSEPTIQDSIAYLARSLTDFHAPLSLGWSLLGLRAAGRAPDLTQLSESYADMERRGLRVADTAVLLLAASDDPISLLQGRTP